MNSERPAKGTAAERTVDPTAEPTPTRLDSPDSDPHALSQPRPGGVPASNVTLDLGGSAQSRLDADVDREIDTELIGSGLDTFQILSLLGRGGMGRVYLAWHYRLERLCALKVIAPELARFEPRRLEMFFSEARAAAQLVHPHVVTVHSLGHDRGYHFIEMEYVKGHSLHELATRPEPLPVERACRIVAQTAQALAAAHERSLVHADVKPDNVLVRDQGWAKLSDFGLARAKSASGGGSGGGEGGGSPSPLVGTPPFMAPELFARAAPHVASDIYALGATLFTALVGHPPFQPATLAEAHALHERAPPPSPSAERGEVPSDLDELVRAMLAKRPADRPGGCDQLAEALGEIADRLTDPGQVIAAAMKGLDATWSEEAGRFALDIPLGGGRHQVVYAELLEAQSAARQLLSFWTPCAPAAGGHDRFVLELNGRLPFGAVSIRAWRGCPYYVMVENHPRGTLDVATVRAAVRHLAQAADEVEQRIIGLDSH